MAHMDNEARKGNGSNTTPSNAEFVDETDAAEIFASHLSRLERQVETLVADAADAAENAEDAAKYAERERRLGLSHVERLRDDADQARFALADANADYIGVRTAQYVDACAAADKAEAEAEALAQATIEEFNSMAPVEQAKALLAEKLGDDAADAILFALTAREQERAATRRKKIATALKVGASMAAMGGLYGGIIGMAVEAAKPKTRRAKIATKLVNWAFAR